MNTSRDSPKGIRYEGVSVFEAGHIPLLRGHKVHTRIVVLVLTMKL